MAKIQETLVLQDQFSSSFGAYIQAAQRASSSTTAAQTAARNYQSVLNSVSRQLISANAKFESYVAQQEEMVAAGQQNTEAFKKLDTQTEKLGATIRGLETQQQTLTQSMKAAENAASVAASAKDEAAAATKRQIQRRSAWRTGKYGAKRHQLPDIFGSPAGRVLYQHSGLEKGR